MLLAGTFSPGEKQLFIAHYTQLVLAEWSAPANIGRLPALRKELRNNLVNSGRSGGSEVHDTLASTALTFLAPRTKTGYHPALRVNAMSMIGDLNEVEAGLSAQARAKPLPAALTELVNAVRDPQQIAAVKVAAMVGIIRHARLGGIAGQNLATVSSTMGSLLQSKAASAQAAAGHAWMQMQAAEVLGLLKISNAAPLLAQIASDASKPFSTRSAAAAALGEMSFQGANADPKPLVAALAKFALDACDAERQPISQRRLKGRLNAASIGAAGLAKGGNSPEIGKLNTSLRAMLDAFGARTPVSDAALINGIRNPRADLRSLLP